MVSPADETDSDPCDAQPDELDVAIAADRFEQALDIPVRRVEHRWAGLRSFAPDRLPVVHPETRQDSSMLSVLGTSEALLVRSPHASPARAGDPCRIIRLDRRIV